MNVCRCAVQAIRLCSAIWSTWPLGLARICSSRESKTSKVKLFFGSTAGVRNCFVLFFPFVNKFYKDAVCDQTASSILTTQRLKQDSIWLLAKRNTWHHADEGFTLVTHGTNKEIKTWTTSFPGWVIIPRQQGWWQRWRILFMRVCQHISLNCQLGWTCSNSGLMSSNPQHGLNSWKKSRKLEVATIT